MRKSRGKETCDIVDRFAQPPTGGRRNAYPYSTVIIRSDKKNASILSTVEGHASRSRSVTFVKWNAQKTADK